MLLAGKNLNLLLAPLAGFSDVGFRAVCARQGADMTFSEMLSAQALKHQSKKTQDMTIVHDEEKFKAAQIFGHIPEDMAAAAVHPALEKFDAVDINMGCPAPKIVKNGDGAALLKDLTLASKIISAVKNSTTRPVSVKVRIGYDKNDIANIIRACQDGGADFVTVHGRTQNQGYSGKVDLEAIAQVCSLAKIPVVGNGDVTNEQSYQAMLSTGVSAVMIGRGAIGRPWIFAELSSRDVKDKFSQILSHVEILRRYYPEKWLTLHLRKHFLSYAASFGAKAEVKRKLAVSPSIDESLQMLKDELNHFENLSKSCNIVSRKEEA